ncbi:MAG TPA: NAD(P)/FAD-dependent oxidoreductase [Ktedonobacterales bacterium]|nr:NAD(P)/FAD-dependent oxidoreductase [Ktedonobacterales bacterium]
MTSRSTAILGGGALGLTLAWRLARAGERVVVYERESLAGGLASGFRVGDAQSGPWLEKFYHHLFRTDRDAIALIGELGLADKLYWGRPNTSSLIDGKPWRLDGALPVLKFSPLPVVDRLRLGAIAALMKALPNADPLEGVTASAWLRRWLGPRAYSLAFEPLFRGKFGSYADEIAMPWFWARIHCRTSALGYLRGGFQQVYEALVAGIETHGGEVRLGVTVESARPTESGAWLVTTAAGEERYERVVSTLPTRVTFKVVPDLPADFRTRYDWGLAYGAHCLILELDRQLMKDVYWLSIADEGYPFLAAVEHTNYIPAEEYGGKHLLYLGNYLPMDHPLMRATPGEALDQFAPYLQRFNPAFSRDWITDVWGFAAPFAQPIVTRDYRAHIPPHETPLPGLYLANMFQVYPQDRGQNYSIKLANELSKRLAFGG